MLRRMNIPLGHMCNRPPQGGHANCKMKLEKGLFYIVNKMKIDTKGKWIELYISYNAHN